MSSTARSAYIKCPWYRSDSTMRIVCDGTLEGMTVALTFSCAQDKQQQMRIFCRGCYEKCEYYRAAAEVRLEEDFVTRRSGVSPISDSDLKNRRA